MLRVFIIYVCCCALAFMVIVASVALVYAIGERKKTKLRYPTLKFKDFTELYALHPEVYTLRDGAVSRQNLGDFRFNMIDTIRYKFWEKRGFLSPSRRKKMKNKCKSYCHMSSVTLICMITKLEKGIELLV